MSAEVIKLSRLLELHVEDEDGRSLGHVHDVRVRRATDDSAYHVEGLVVGPRGLLVRLGWRRASDPTPLSARDVVPWDDVLAIETDRLVVRREREL